MSGAVTTPDSAKATPPPKRRTQGGNNSSSRPVASQHRHLVVNLIVSELSQVYPPCIHFPVHYSRVGGGGGQSYETREAPNLINEMKHGVWTPPTAELRIQNVNGNKLPLYKIGPGAVAFKVVLNAFNAGGMKYTPRDDWNILWAKRVKPHEWAVTDVTRKSNHFPGTWGVGRKDNLARNIGEMRKLHGAEHYGYTPMTFILPEDADRLQRDMLMNVGKTYITKPVASSCGKGISLTRSMPTIPKSSKTLLVQRYIPNPHLICGRKFDLRMYCVVTSFHPLRLYVFDEGLVRFAAQSYPGADAQLENIHMHLTNY
eukprot:PhF_6_TR37119/c0_g1_i2/m.54555/K16601/TTLL4; tubulin polyglutamylase TTLL4